MFIKTKNFGLIEVNEEKILKFPKGIYGFEDCHKFVLLSEERNGDPFIWMQSIKYYDLCFVVINPYEVIKDYEPKVKDGIKEALSVMEKDELVFLCIVTIPKNNPSNMTINLKCPIIINNSTQIAIQDIMESSKYKMRYPFFEDYQKQWKQHSFLNHYALKSTGYLYQ